MLNAILERHMAKLHTLSHNISALYIYIYRYCLRERERERESAQLFGRPKKVHLILPYHVVLFHI